MQPTINRVQLEFDRSWIDPFQERIENDGPWDSWDLFQLGYYAEEKKQIASFDELQCLKHLPYLEPYPHQIETAKKVLNEMRGRAILADEVGLGKTIEAGLIIKEYMIRGLVKKVLILVPASLVLQWSRELGQKFGIQAVAQKKEYMWKQYDCIVASMDTAKRDPHRQHILSTDYDMVIIDEAHKLKNKNTKNYQFINEIKKKYCLLLTATPVQNDLNELFNLITLLKPGHLGQQGSFLSNYVSDKRVAKNEVQLQKELSKVMIRNRRSDGVLEFTKRKVKNVFLELSEPEQKLYDGVNDFIRGRYEESGGDQNMLSLITLQREVCSSRDAVFITLVNMFKKTPQDSPVRKKILELVDIIKRIEAHSKAEKMMEILEQIDDKVIIFTEYRATQEYLTKYLKQREISSVPYRGGFGRGKKDWMMDLFKRRAQVMIATEAGGEGINLQFCNHVINYDLPWNPMRVEQRIGRVHRLGQTRDVQIYNLSTRGTIEEYILHLLHEKINMFEMVIGSLEAILERWTSKSKAQSVESSLAKIMLESKSDTEIRSRLDQIGQEFHQYKQVVEHEPIHP